MEIFSRGKVKIRKKNSGKNSEKKLTKILANMTNRLLGENPEIIPARHCETTPDDIAEIES